MSLDANAPKPLAVTFYGVGLCPAIEFQMFIMIALYNNKNKQRLQILVHIDVNVSITHKKYDRLYFFYPYN